MSEKVDKTKKSAMNISVDPIRTPILYADSVRITSNENGFVLDIAQGVASTNQAIVVARIGMSHAHAKKLAEMIGQQLLKQNVRTGGKKKVVN